MTKGILPPEGRYVASFPKGRGSVYITYLYNAYFRLMGKNATLLLFYPSRCEDR
jgi:hypothetical protein